MEKLVMTQFLSHEEEGEIDEVAEKIKLENEKV